jgi:hypothetical protein
MLTSNVWVCYLYERTHCGGECLHESRMREICTSGSTRGEGRGYRLHASSSTLPSWR